MWFSCAPKTAVQSCYTFVAFNQVGVSWQEMQWNVVCSQKFGCWSSEICLMKIVCYNNMTCFSCNVLSFYPLMCTFVHQMLLIIIKLTYMLKLNVSVKYVYHLFSSNRQSCCTLYSINTILFLFRMLSNLNQSVLVALTSSKTIVWMWTQNFDVTVLHAP